MRIVNLSCTKHGSCYAQDKVRVGSNLEWQCSVKRTVSSLCIEIFGSKLGIKRTPINALAQK